MALVYPRDKVRRKSRQGLPRRACAARPCRVAMFRFRFRPICVCRGLDKEIDMPEIGAILSLAEIYDGVEFPARPRLVTIEPDASPASENDPDRA
jgi:hypothetical protein